MAVATCEVRIHVFEVGEVYVDVGGHEAERLHAVVAAGVVDRGGEEASRVEGFDDGGDVDGVVCGADEADDVLGLLEHFGYAVDDGVNSHVRGCIAGSQLAAADVVILTVDALQVAVGEEDVADAFLATDWGLFALVDTDRCHLGQSARMAKSKTHNAVGLTGSGTDVAFHAAKVRRKIGLENFFVMGLSVRLLSLGMDVAIAVMGLLRDLFALAC